MSKGQRKKIYQKLLNKLESYEFGHYFLCIALSDELHKGERINEEEVNEKFPEFSLFEPPQEEYHDSVWVFENNKQRAICLEFCILMCN